MCIQRVLFAKHRYQYIGIQEHLHFFELKYSSFRSFRDFLPVGTADINHFPTNSWVNLMNYGMSSNAMSCQSLWQYPGGAKAVLGVNIGQPTGGTLDWCYIGWVYWGDSQPAAPDNA